MHGTDKNQEIRIYPQYTEQSEIKLLLPWVTGLAVDKENQINRLY
jgi:hypothetical protein